MTINEMIEKKREYGWTYEMIAEKSKIPLATVQKIFSGVTKSPRYETVMALEALFNSPAEVREEPDVYEYGRENYTVDDWENLPDNVRAELINGKIYYMGQPSLTHQDIVGHLYVKFFSYIEKKQGQCKPYISPIGVRLHQDNKTMVEPDFLVVCDKSKLSGDKWIDGAPDFVAEVLSTSSSKRDFVLKYKEYKKAGVKEYWMIDPQDRVVYVSDFSDETIAMRIMNFDEEIPVLIYNGCLTINLSKFGIEQK